MRYFFRNVEIFLTFLEKSKSLVHFNGKFFDKKFSNFVNILYVAEKRLSHSEANEHTDAQSRILKDLRNLLQNVSSSTEGEVIKAAVDLLDSKKYKILYHCLEELSKTFLNLPRVLREKITLGSLPRLITSERFKPAVMSFVNIFALLSLNTPSNIDKLLPNSPFSMKRLLRF